MIKAIILDFDGLIVDTEKAWYDIFKKWFLEKKQYSLPIEEFLICVGSHSQNLFDRLEKDRGISVSAKEFANDTYESFIEYTKDIPARPGVAEFIRNVKKENLKLALCTSSMRMKPLSHLTRLGLISYFDELITAELVKKLKPAPDLYLEALKKLNVPAAAALAFEDSLNGYISASGAKIKTFVIVNDVTKHSIFPKEASRLDTFENVSVPGLIS